MFQTANKVKRFSNLIGYLSAGKIINWVKLQISYRLSFFGWQRLRNLSPSFISVEASNYCNLHCPECPVGIQKKQKSDKTTFDIDLYKKLVDELKPTLQHIILYFQGEPFLHRQLNELISYAHEARIYTSTSTNGQFINEETAEKIVLSGLDKLIISLDGITQEAYQSYRIGGDLQKTLRGIEELVKWKQRLKSATPLLEIQFLVLKTNEHQIKEVKKIGKKLGVDRVRLKSAQLYDFKDGNALMTSKNKHSRYKKNKVGKYEIKGSQSNRCWRLWSGAVVNTKGDILPCCFDKESEYSFGNISTSESFYSCWHNEKASDFRGKILQNRKQFEICRNCTT